MFANAAIAATRQLRFALLAAAMALSGPVSAALPDPPPEVEDIPVVLLVDFGSGQILHARNPDRRFLPASMTKVMTAFVAFEEIARGKLDPRQQIAVREATAREWNGKGTSMYLEAGERVLVSDLLHGIMTASANDASVVLAEGYAGSVSSWTALMNRAAGRLGMTHSRFATPNGWPDGGRTYVSARDLVRLASAMIRHFPDQYAAYSGKKTFKWHDRMLFSHDPVTGVIEGADGIKTGYTREAGYNFLGSASRDGRRLVMVTGGAASDDQRLAASRALLEWGYANWRARPLFDAGEIIASVQVQGGTSAQVAVAAANPVYATVPLAGDEPIRLHLRYTGPVKAPIKRNDRVAELEIHVGDMAAGRIPLVAARQVANGGPMDRLAVGFMNLWR